MANSFQDMLAQVLASRTQQQFGLSPFDPKKNVPQDFGLGGMSTEYVSTDQDDKGNLLNYPTIWFSPDGTGNMLSPEDGLQQAAAYEYATGKKFPRFNSIGNADTFAQHRSAMEGGMLGPLATLFGSRNW